MQTTVSTQIAAPRDRVWRLSTDIANAADVIQGIESVEILEQPTDGLVGLKWRETRTLFGKEATETMWVTGADAPEQYVVEARSHGTHYRTVIRLQEEGGGTRLSMQFEGIPEKTVSRIMAAILGPLMKRSVTKALQKDLDDIKKAAEATQSTGPYVPTSNS